MSDLYVAEEQEAIDAESIINQTNNVKDLLNIEFIAGEDNIILLKKILRILYSDINKLRQEVNSIKPRIKS